MNAPSLSDRARKHPERCGILGLRLPRAFKLAVPFSCKRRGLCPSCCAKRMSEIAFHLVDNVLPHAPYRQWVATFPHALRYWMTASRKLTSLVHRRVRIARS